TPEGKFSIKLLRVPPRDTKETRPVLITEVDSVTRKFPRGVRIIRRGDCKPVMIVCGWANAALAVIRIEKRMVRCMSQTTALQSSGRCPPRHFEVPAGLIMQPTENAVLRGWYHRRDGESDAPIIDAGGVRFLRVRPRKWRPCETRYPDTARQATLAGPGCPAAPAGRGGVPRRASAAALAGRDVRRFRTRPERGHQQAASDAGRF